MSTESRVPPPSHEHDRLEGPRELVLGVAAMDLRLIDRATLLNALAIWRRQTNKSLGQVLVDQGWLSPKHEELLEALVDSQNNQHRPRLSTPPSIAAGLPSTPSDTDSGATLMVPFDQQSQGDSSIGDSTNGQTMAWPVTDHSVGVGAWRHVSDLLRERLYAEGGLGQIWLCEQDERVIQRRVAVKQLRPVIADDPHRRQQFEFEAQVTCLLEHPNIVPVYALGRGEDGRPYYVMRFIQGELLRERISEFHNATKHVSDLSERDVDLRKLLSQFVSICETIHYAHSRGVLHRDIKPDNIKIGKHGQVVVLDWGLALPIDPKRHDISTDEPSAVTERPKPLENIEEGRFVGTPGYASPEQASGKLQNMGPRSDVYSLGATLYCLLTGSPPIQGDNTVDIITKAQRGEYQRPREVNSRVPKPLEAICLKAMAYAPDKRYASAKQLASDIEHWLADAPVTAYPEHFVARARRFARHHRAATTASVVVAVIAAMSLGVYIFDSRRLALERAGRQQAFAAIEEALFPADSKQRLMENTNPSLRLQEKYEWIVGTEYLGNRVGDPNRARVQAKMAMLPHPIERTMSFFSKAEASYQDLIALNPNVAEYKAEYAQLLVNRGSIERDNRSADASRKDLNDAIDRLKQLVASNPSSRHEQLLAKAYHELASLMSGEGKQDQLIAAENFYMLSRKIRQELVARYPGADGVEFRHELAMSDGWLGDLYLLLGEFDKARQSYQTSLSLREQLHNDAPDNWERSWQLARAYNNFLNIYGEYGDPKFAEGNDKQLQLALDSATKAHELQMEIVGKSPANVDYRSDLGWTNSIMADILVDQLKSAEAAPLVFAAKKEYQELIRHDPDNPSHHSSLAWAYVILAKYHRLEGEMDESRAALKDAEEELKFVMRELDGEGKPIENPERKSDSDFLTAALIHALRAKDLTGTDRAAEVRTAIDELKQWDQRGMQGALRLGRDTDIEEL